MLRMLPLAVTLPRSTGRGDCAHASINGATRMYAGPECTHQPLPPQVETGEGHHACRLVTGRAMSRGHVPAQSGLCAVVPSACNTNGG